MYLIFVTNNNIGSIATRWWCFSEYSHVVLAYKNRVIGANFWGGIQEETLEMFCSKYKKKKFCRVDNIDDEKVWAFAKSKVGLPYDYTALFGLLLRTSWDEPDSYFCSELVTAALDAGGVLLYRKTASRITPQMLLDSPLVIPDI